MEKSETKKQARKGHNQQKERSSREKRLNSKQKIALERIYRLFELAEPNNEYTKRYIQLAKRLGEKNRVGVPKELKQKFCKKCFSVNMEAAEKKPFLIVKCMECGHEKKFGLEN